jgi:hypothetical protein
VAREALLMMTHLFHALGDAAPWRQAAPATS